MVFGVADDGYANAEARGYGALGDGVSCVVRAFRVDVGAQFLEKSFDVGLGKNYDVVHCADSSDEKGAGLFVENGTAGAFEKASTGIGVDGYDEDVAFGFRTGQIAGVADMERIEDAVGEDNVLAALFAAAQ